MRAEYTEVWIHDGVETIGPKKVVRLPFGRVSARAIIVRKADGAILGTLHRQDGRYALPGGAVENGESTLEAVLRELDEENISLIDPDDAADEAMAVDFFGGYKELSVWHLFLVDDAQIGDSEENVISRWVSQDEDVWYPGMRERLLIEISKYLPDSARRSLKVI
jgi:hypothetical protein